MGVTAGVAAVVVLAAAVAALYNSLVSARLGVREAWSAVDVQLQRRASLIPNLVDVVKGYAWYERDTLLGIVEAREAVGAAAGPRTAASADAALTGALGAFFALAEAYPDLKANERYASLQSDLVATENTIAHARNYYNAAVQLYNTRLQRFPAVVLAGALGFRPAEFFAAEPGARDVVGVAV